MEYHFTWVGIFVESLDHCKIKIFLGQGRSTLNDGAKNSHKRSSVKKITYANSVRRKLYLQYISEELREDAALALDTAAIPLDCLIDC